MQSFILARDTLQAQLDWYEDQLPKLNFEDDWLVIEFDKIRCSVKPNKISVVWPDSTTDITCDIDLIAFTGRNRSGLCWRARVSLLDSDGAGLWYYALIRFYRKHDQSVCIDLNMWDIGQQVSKSCLCPPWLAANALETFNHAIATWKIDQISID